MSMSPEEKKKRVIIETLVNLQSAFKQHYKPELKHILNESTVFAFEPKRESVKKRALSFLQLSRMPLTQEKLYCFPKLV